MNNPAFPANPDPYEYLPEDDNTSDGQIAPPSDLVLGQTIVCARQALEGNDTLQLDVDIPAGVTISLAVNDAEVAEITLNSEGYPTIRVRTRH